MTKQRLAYFVAAILILAAIGFVGYHFGFLRFIYNVMIPGTFSNYNIVLLSIIFGVAAFFSPCAFTVLPAYVSNYLGKEEREKSKMLARSLYFGIIAALGIVTVNMVIGLVIALLGSATPFAKDPRQDIPLILGIRALAGLLIAALGLAMLFGKSPNLHFVQRFFSKSSFAKSMYASGIIYNAAAIGCTGPILLGLMLYSFASGSFGAAVLAFAAFSVTMGMLMVALTLLTGAFKNAIAARLEGVAPIVKTAAAIVMVVVGLSIFLLTLEGNELFVKLFFPYLK